MDNPAPQLQPVPRAPDALDALQADNSLMTAVLAAAAGRRAGF